MTNESDVSVTMNDKITFPKTLPVEYKVPKDGDINFADNEKTVKNVLAWVKGYKEEFDSQSAMDNFKNTKLDLYDEMYRCSKTRTGLEVENADNKDKTKSNVASTAFHRIVNGITSGETEIILGNNESLPVVFEPVPINSETSVDNGKSQCDYENALLWFTFICDNIFQKIRDALLMVNKDANLLVEMVWDNRKAKRKRRVLNQQKNGYEVITEDVLVADNPSLIIHDWRNVWMDSQIDDIQNQTCVITRFQKQYETLLQMQAAGKIKNVDKIKHAQLYAGEGSDTIKSDRESNAGESETNSPTNMVDLYMSRIRIPVDDESGEWSPDSTVSHWYDTLWAGDLNGSPICLCVTPNPHWSGNIPLLLMHSHQDNKGALHLGYGDLTESLYMMETTIIDELFDNIRLRNNKPWIIEKGTVSVRSKKFGPNRVWYKMPGAQDPHEIETQDTTLQSIPMLNKIREFLEEVANTNKPFFGEAFGARTSAAEATNAYQQAMKPSLERAKYKAEQLLPFIAYWSKEMWSQFGDPERVMTITYQDKIYQFRSSDIKSDVKIRITCIKNFQDNYMERRSEDVFFSQYFPIAMKTQGFNAQIPLEAIANKRKYPNVEKWWSEGDSYDARHVADSESIAILLYGKIDYPQEQENHKIHIEQHQSDLAGYMLGTPDEQQNSENVGKLKEHIRIHELYQSKSAPRQTPAVTESEPRTIGEVGGDQMGAMGGAEVAGTLPEEPTEVV
jgi:hypothetical protein